MHIKSNLIYLRNKNNLPKRTLARLSNVNHAVIHLIETGKTSEQKITIDTVSKLASFFQVTIDDFIYKDLSQNNDVSPNDTERNNL